MSIDPKPQKIGLLAESTTINLIRGLPYLMSSPKVNLFLVTTSTNFLCFYSLKHEAFMLGTHKTKPDSGGFDLFITTAPIPDLNEKINVFGRVIKGEDVVQVHVLHFSLSYTFLLVIARLRQN